MKVCVRVILEQWIENRPIPQSGPDKNEPNLTNKNLVRKYEAYKNLVLLDRCCGNQNVDSINRTV